MSSKTVLIVAAVAANWAIIGGAFVSDMERKVRTVWIILYYSLGKK